MKKFLNKTILVIAFLSFTFANFSSSVFAKTYEVNDFVAGTQVSQADPGSIFSKVIAITFVIAAILAFSYLIYGAMSIITSGGEASKKTAGKDRITYAAIGLLILAAVWAIFTLVMTISFGNKDISLPVLNDSTLTN